MILAIAETSTLNVTLFTYDSCEGVALSITPITPEGYLDYSIAFKTTPSLEDSKREASRIAGVALDFGPPSNFPLRGLLPR